MLKIALYLNDVDEDGGPLQMLRRRLPDHDRMVGGKFGSVRQGQLEKARGDFDLDRDVVTCTGKAGTLASDRPPRGIIAASLHARGIAARSTSTI